MAKLPMKKLEEYQRKRRFDRTPEPPPDAAASQRDGAFVVQKHAATRLHYDFRLAIDGVLKSWAVPKGPSLNPADKRLAVQTEDHPMDYANFEGNIPKGNYGAGTVMVWDRGGFEVEGQAGAHEQLAHGEIKFQLAGEKLRGSFVLVKLKHSEKGNEWLLIKHKDASVDPAWNVDDHDGSAITGRTLEEIAEELPPKREAHAISPEQLEGARKSAMPSRVAPMLATLLEQPFSDPDWLFEIKWDGERALTWIADGKATLRSRTGKDITAQYPELACLPEAFHAKRVIVDGEIVVLDERGHSDFERLQERMHVRAPSSALIERHPATYYAFDLLYCDGYDLRDAALLERKELLRRILRPDKCPGGRVRFSDHQAEKGKELFELARQEGLEGVIGKRADSHYSGSRSTSWVKIKATRVLDAVVGGWTAPRGAREHFGSLLLGLYEDGKLRFIGHVGSGFDNKKIAAIMGELRPLAVAKCPFEQAPETNEKAFWVKPELVARVRFAGLTQERRLRAPVFIAMREDARPEDSRWEGELMAAPAPPDPPGSTNLKAAQAVTRAPEIAGKVLSGPVKIEAELSSGKQETIVVELDGKRFRLTHLNKVYFPESGYTKRDLLAYYYHMADTILPFLKDRPLVLRRYPDGITGQAFFQKDLREGVPDWLETIAIPSESAKDGKNEVHYAIANDRASLLFLTGLGCIDHNPWSSRRDDLEHPDYFFFDLDPSDGTEFSVVIAVARALQKKLDELGLKIFLKTSGATGFHIYVPVERGYAYEQLRIFGEIVSRLVTERVPNLVTHERIVAKRPAGRVLIDVQQNSLGKPLAAPYSVRAFPKAPVSTPVQPSELRPNLRPEKFNLRTLARRLQETGDLWANFWKNRQRIEKAFEKIHEEMPRRHE
jgi:bifunctional non-homologous end joining protein LigD